MAVDYHTLNPKTWCEEFLVQASRWLELFILTMAVLRETPSMLVVHKKHHCNPIFISIHIVTIFTLYQAFLTQQYGFVRRPQTTTRIQFNDWRDFEPKHYIGHGMVNDVMFVELPSNHSMLRDCRFRRWVVKIVYNSEYGWREIDAWRRLNHHTPTASRLGILPIIYAAQNITNPFIVEQYGWKIHRSVPSAARKRLLGAANVDLIVLPYVEKKFILKTTRNMRDRMHWFHNLLQQLDWAHQNHVNNFDLSIGRNIYVTDTTTFQAVLFDWNGMILEGEPLYDPTQSWELAPPESWLEPWYGIPMRLTEFHAADVWQAGIALAQFIYDPCQWVSKRQIPEQDLLYETLRSLSDRSTTMIIDVNHTHQTDLWRLVTEQSQSSRRSSQFSPLLAKTSLGRELCSPKSSKYLSDPSVPQIEKDMAVDLLRQMLQVLPKDRPSCAKLLQHPYFRLVLGGR